MTFAVFVVRCSTTSSTFQNTPQTTKATAEAIKRRVEGVRMVGSREMVEVSCLPETVSDENLSIWEEKRGRQKFARIFLFFSVRNFERLAK